MASWRRRSVLAAGAALAGLPRGPAADEGRFVRIATGSVTGTYYPVATAIAGLLSRPPGARACEEAGECGVADLILVVEASKGSVANVEAIGRGEVESGFAQSDVAWGAFAGQGVFAGRPRSVTCARWPASISRPSICWSQPIPGSRASPTCAVAASRSTSRARVPWSMPPWSSPPSAWRPATSRSSAPRRPARST